MRASRCSGVRSGSMRGRRRKVGAMSELRPDAQADGERRVGVVEPARDVEAQRPYRRFPAHADRSEEHTSELQSLMRISYAVFCLKKKKKPIKYHQSNNT